MARVSDVKTASKQWRQKKRQSSESDFLDASFTQADLAKLDHTNIELSPMQDTSLTEAPETFSADSFQIEVDRKTRELHIGRQEAETEVFIDRLVMKMGSQDKALLYVISELESEARIQVLVSILLNRGANPSTSNKALQTPLHLAAHKNIMGVAVKLLENDATPIARDGKGKLPLHIAIDKGEDQMAATLLSYMSNYLVRSLFTSDGSKAAEISFHNLLHRNLEKTTLAVLDCMLEPYGTGDEVRVFYSMLEADESGRPPSDPVFNCHQYTVFQLIAKTGNKTVVNHDAVRLLIRRKWKMYARTQFILNCIVYTLSLFAMTFAAISGVDAADPTQYGTGLDIARGVFEVIAVLTALYTLFTEINQMRRSRLDYLKDGFNFFEFPSAVLILTVIPLRFTHAYQQWYVFSIGFLLWSLRLFKYATIFRQTGAYAQILWQIIAHDIVQFTAVFLVILLAFSGAFMLALRGDNGLDVHQETSTFWGIVFIGVRILSEAERIIDYTGPGGYRTMSSILYVCFLFTILVILLNLLIAQLSDTYQNIQTDAHRGLEVHRAWSVARVELNSWCWGQKSRDWYYVEFEDLDLSDALEKWDTPPLSQMSVYVREIWDNMAAGKMDAQTVRNRQARQESAIKSMQCQLDRIEQLLSNHFHQQTALERLEHQIMPNHPIHLNGTPRTNDQLHVTPDTVWVDGNLKRSHSYSGSINARTGNDITPQKAYNRRSERSENDRTPCVRRTHPHSPKAHPPTHTPTGSERGSVLTAPNPKWRILRTHQKENDSETGIHVKL